MVLPGEPANIFAALLQIALGLVLGFAGLRLAESIAGLAGFLGGAVLGFLLGTIIGGPVVGLVAALVLGILLAILAHFALRLLAAVLAGGLAASIALTFGLATWLVVLLAIVVGLFGLIGHRVVLIVATAAVGASAVAGAGVYLLTNGGVNVGTEEMAYFLGAFVLTAAGIVVQARAARRG